MMNVWFDESDKNINKICYGENMLPEPSPRNYYENDVLCNSRTIRVMVFAEWFYGRHVRSTFEEALGEMILADHARYRVLKVFEDLDAVMRIIKKDVQGFRVHFGDLADRTAASLETFQRATSFKDKFVYTRWFFELVSRMYRSYDTYFKQESYILSSKKRNHVLPESLLNGAQLSCYFLEVKGWDFEYEVEEDDRRNFLDLTLEVDVPNPEIHFEEHPLKFVTLWNEVEADDDLKRPSWEFILRHLRLKEKMIVQKNRGNMAGANIILNQMLPLCPRDPMRFDTLGLPYIDEEGFHRNLNGFKVSKEPVFISLSWCSIHAVREGIFERRDEDFYEDVEEQEEFPSESMPNKEEFLDEDDYSAEKFLGAVSDYQEKLIKSGGRLRKGSFGENYLYWDLCIPVLHGWFTLDRVVQTAEELRRKDKYLKNVEFGLGVFKLSRGKLIPSPRLIFFWGAEMVRKKKNLDFLKRVWRTLVNQSPHRSLAQGIINKTKFTSEPGSYKYKLLIEGLEVQEEEVLENGGLGKKAILPSAHQGIQEADEEVRTVKEIFGERPMGPGKTTASRSRRRKLKRAREEGLTKKAEEELLRRLIKKEE